MCLKSHSSNIRNLIKTSSLYRLVLAGFELYRRFSSRFRYRIILDKE
jgi:hypothetical protein